MAIKGDAVPSGSELTYQQLNLKVNGVGLTVATASRGGERAPIVFLHGFGSTKEDYADIALRREPSPGGRSSPTTHPGAGRPPARTCRRSRSRSWSTTAQAVLRDAGIERFHLVGHSMGGLTALLLLAHQDPGRVLSFVDIEGNSRPEDCFLSRQVLTHPANDAQRFLDDFIERTRRSPSSPAPCTRPACATRYAPVRCAESSSRWSSCPTTVT